MKAIMRRNTLSIFKHYYKRDRLCLKDTTQRFYHELSYAQNGEPVEVLTYQATSPFVEDSKLPDGEQQELVKVQMLHAPWNPADVNVVQGKYASPYDSPGVVCTKPNNQSQHFDGRTVSGSEGWGRVISSQSSSLPEGSLVTMSQSGLGTLRSSLWVPPTALLPVPNDLLDKLGPAGSSLFQLGGTALRMLTDFVSLQPGEVVIQNAGNSGVGLMLSQLAPAIFSAPVVSLVRRGSRTPAEFESLVDYLQSTGKNAMVIAEEDLDEPDLRKGIQARIRDLSATGQLPKLAVNAVGGTSAQSLLRLLDSGGSLVTYGGMSGKPVIVATPQLIFKDFKVAGYWHSRWMVQNAPSTKQALISSLVEAVQVHGVQCPPCQVFPLKDVREALHWQSEQGAVRKKLVFDCS